MNNIELLAPGGDVLSVKAAIIAGADAVFCGVGKFNARKRATNITLKEFQELSLIAKEHNVKLYVTLNTVMLDGEIIEILNDIYEIQKFGAHGVIIQDYGLIRLVRRFFPNLDIHASTQMTTHNEGQIDFLSRFTVKQVNLSRELSIEEIRPLAKKAKSLNIETEVFVHGAFCVSFSGQCYFSINSCGESGNRGACVQSCRRAYTDKSSDTNKKLPFNLKDNSAFKVAAPLIDAGATSLKIEGRIKDFYYVYSTVKTWREKLSNLGSTSDIEVSSEKLNTVFNRDFTDGYLTGIIDKSMFNSNKTKDESLIDGGNIISYYAMHKTLKIKKKVELTSGDTIKIFDGVNFICEGSLGREITKGEFHFTINNKLNGKILKDQKVMLQRGALEKREVNNEISKLEAHKIQLDAEIYIKVGEPITLIFRGDKKSVKVLSDSVVDAAKSRGADRSSIKKSLSKLGDTPYQLGEVLFNEFDENSFVPVKILNDLRRRCVDKLINLPKFPFYTPPIGEESNRTISPKIAVLTDSLLDLESYSNHGFITIFEIPPRLDGFEKEIIEILNKYPKTIAHFPPILIDKDFEAAKTVIQSISPRTVIVNNSGVAELAIVNKLNWIAGHFLNITNSEALQLFKNSGALGSFLSFELGDSQKSELIIPRQFQMWHTIYGPQFMMNSRQCFIRSAGHCQKDETDSNCIDCSRYTTLYSDHKQPYHIIKRKRFYNQILANKNLLDTFGVSQNIYQRYLVDLRNLKSSSDLTHSKTHFLNIVKDFVDSSGARSNELLNSIENYDRRKSFYNLK